MIGLIIYIGIFIPASLIALYFDMRKNAKIKEQAEEIENQNRMLREFKYTEADMNEFYQWAQLAENRNLKSPVTYWELERFSKASVFAFEELQTATEELLDIKPNES